MKTRILSLALTALCLVPGGALAQSLSFQKGDIYTLDWSGRKILRVDPDDYSVSTFVDLTSEGSYPNSLTFSGNGRMLVSIWGSDKIIEVRADGSRRTRWTHGLNGPWGQKGMAVDRQGNTFVINYDTNQLLKFYNTNGHLVFADGADGLSSPESVVVTETGELFVGNGDGTILHFDADGNGSTFDTLPDPDTSLALRDNGDLYAATSSGPIYRYRHADAGNRTLLVTMAASAYNSLDFNLDHSKLLYTSTNGGLDAIHPGNGKVTSLVAPGTLGDSLAVDVVPTAFAAGTGFSVDYHNRKIWQIEANTHAPSAFVDLSSKGQWPSSAFFPDEHRLWVLSFGSDQLLEYDEFGNETVVFDSSDGLDGPWGEPGLAMNGAGDVFVSCIGNQTILRFPDGQGPAEVFADSSDGLSSMESIRLDPQGNLWVMNGDSKILHFDRDGNATVFDTLPEAGRSIEIRGNGDIYALTIAGSLYRYLNGDGNSRQKVSGFGQLSYASLQFDAGHRLLYFCDSDGALLSKNMESNTNYQHLPDGSLGKGSGLAFAPGRDKGPLTRLYGPGTEGAGGFMPSLAVIGNPNIGGELNFHLRDFAGGASAVMPICWRQAEWDAYDGTILVDLSAMITLLAFNLPGFHGDPGAGDWEFTLPVLDDSIAIDLNLFAQVLAYDSDAPRGISMSNAVHVRLGTDDN